MSTTLIVLASCGGGSGGGQSSNAAACVSSPAPAAAAGADRPAFAIAAVDDRFVPACVVVPANGAVRLVVRNEGRHPHNVVFANGARVSVDAGGVQFVDVDTAAGDLGYRCTIHPGMDGVLRGA